MTAAPSRARFDVDVDSVVRTYHHDRDTAFEAARFLQVRNPGAKITVTDLRDGSPILIARPEAVQPRRVRQPVLDDLQ